MDIEVMPLSQLLTAPEEFLSRYTGPGRALVIELPDHRLVSIHSLEPDDEEGSLASDLLETNPQFRELVERSRASPRQEFTRGAGH